MCREYYQLNKSVKNNNFNDDNINIIPKTRLIDTVNNIYMETLNNKLNKDKNKSKCKKNIKSKLIY